MLIDFRTSSLMIPYGVYSKFIPFVTKSYAINSKHKWKLIPFGIDSVTYSVRNQKSVNKSVERYDRFY